MLLNQFGQFLKLTKPMILKKNTVRALMPPDERLATVPSFLASAKSQTS